MSDIEAMRSAARQMEAAADSMNRAAANIHSAIDRFQTLWASTVSADLAVLVHRLEVINEDQKKRAGQ